MERWELYVSRLISSGKKVFISSHQSQINSTKLLKSLSLEIDDKALFPFSCKEFIDFLNLQPDIQSLQLYLRNGGFVEYLNTGKVQFLHQLTRNILLQDIGVRYGVRNIDTFLRITGYLFSNIGNELTFTKIKNLFEVGSTNSVIDYLTWMEDFYLLSLCKNLVTISKVFL